MSNKHLVLSLAVLVPVSAAPAVDDLKWLSTDPIPLERVTQELNAIAKASCQEARALATALREIRENGAKAGKERAQASTLLEAAAVEVAGDDDSAKALYEELRLLKPQTRYTVSADFRMQVLGLNGLGEKTVGEVFTAMRKKPPLDGWFRVDDQWIQGTTREAALHMLVGLRGNHASFGFLQYLRSRSPFPRPYAYIMVLLVLTLATRVLVLPLLIRGVSAGRRLAKLRPELEHLRIVYAGDPLALQQATMELYRSKGINIFAGCLSALLDLVFVIWALVVMSDFSVQLSLDYARFFWVTDVTRFSSSIVLCFSFVMLVVGLMQRNPMQTVPQVFLGTIVASGFIGLISWYWAWPAYVFVLWMMQVLVGSILQWMIKGVQRVVGG